MNTAEQLRRIQAAMKGARRAPARITPTVMSAPEPIAANRVVLLESVEPMVMLPLIVRVFVPTLIVLRLIWLEHATLKEPIVWL